MDRASYYRERADHVRQLAEMTWQDDLEALLRLVAQDYDEIAKNLEAGATETRRCTTFDIGGGLIGAGAGAAIGGAAGGGTGAAIGAASGGGLGAITGAATTPPPPPPPRY
jgi:hypothetical protein